MAPFFYVGKLEVPSYTVMLLAGFAAGLALALHRRRHSGLPADIVLAAYFLAGVGAFLGGKLFFVFQGWDRFLALQAEGVRFTDFFSAAGMVSYGGIAGTVAFLFLGAAVLREPVWRLISTLLPSLPLAQSFGRVGCLLAGCCYGVPVSWGLWMNPASGAPTDAPLLPIQLLEAAGTLGICLFLAARDGRDKKSPGWMLGTYLILYGALRFVLEFWRYDAVRGFVGTLSVGQWCSLLAAAAGAALLAAARTRPAPEPLPRQEASGYLWRRKY